MGAHFDSATDLGGTVNYTCAWCDREVASDRGWTGQNHNWGRPGAERWFHIVLCPNCSNPTYFRGMLQTPGVAAGDEVEHLPDDVAALYGEARGSAAAGNYTAAVLTGRKVLMHVAVEKGAEGNRPFGYYVEWLTENGIVTSDMKGWVDEIRELGNDANHEIVLMGKEEADELLTFVSMLLKVVYEFPERGRRSVDARQARDAGEDAPAEETPALDDGGAQPPPTL